MGSLTRKIRTNGIDLIVYQTCKKVIPPKLSKSARRRFLSYAVECVNRLETFLKELQ